MSLSLGRRFKYGPEALIGVHFDDMHHCMSELVGLNDVSVHL